MLKRMDVKGYKCIEEASFKLEMLTLVTGTNASGKSTLLQAVLIALKSKIQKNSTYLNEVIKPYIQIEEVLCRTSDAREIDVCVYDDSDGWLHTKLSHAEEWITFDPSINLDYEESIFYLAADRKGPEELVPLSKELSIGQHGQFAVGHFELNKDKPISLDICSPEAPAKTLKAQLAWWLSFITGVNCEANTQKVTSTTVKLSFTMGVLGEVSPLNTGAGNSYLLKLLVMCMIAKPGHVLLIENPEIHLHPGAQSRLGVLFGFLAARGVQLIVETHCEHLINRIRYEVYKQKLNAKDVVLYYKPSVDQEFIQMGILPTGHFCNKEGGRFNFPSGFFDSTLSELLEIG